MKLSEQFAQTMSIDVLAAAISTLPGGAAALEAAADDAVIAALEAPNA